mmetsp:Transcript_18517/g.18501  ORF Transcript_18517/g.18501 Transcript_18517/m.18501 type:complete len:245 (+) Transcript_18517:256-990(+)
MMQQQILAMNSIDAQRDKNHEQVILKQKELYIQLLLNQLRLRDNVIDIQNDIFNEENIGIKPDLKKIYSQIQSIDEINSSSIISFPDLHMNSPSFYGRSKPKAYKSDHFLPPITQAPTAKTSALNTPHSRIPKVASKRYLSNEQKAEKFSNINLLHPKAKRLTSNDNRLKEQRSKTNSGLYEDSESDRSSVKQIAIIGKTSDKYQKSPKVGYKGRDIGHVIKKRIKPREIKYGVNIRGIETFEG